MIEEFIHQIAVPDREKLAAMPPLLESLVERSEHMIGLPHVRRGEATGQSARWTPKDTNQVLLSMIRT